MIELINVTKTFRTEHDSVEAVSDVSLEIEKGDIYGIIGLSGAGKSTLVRCINFLEVPTSGQVKFKGVDLASLSKKELLKTRRSIAMIFQNFNLLAQRTALANVCYPMEISGVPKKKAVERAKELLKVVGLEDRMKSYPAQLSGGMAQRVALVRTLINEPEILLLDEPLGALDEFTRMNMQDEILNIWSQKKQLALMVTHSIDEAVYMGTRVLVMESNPGRIVADIRIDEDFPRDRSSASFVEYRNEILNRLHFGGKKD